MRIGALIAALAVGCTTPARPTVPTPAVAPPAKRTLRVDREYVSNKVPAVRAEWLVITLPSEAASRAITADLESAAREAATDFLAMAHDAKKDEPRDPDGMPSVDQWELSLTCQTTALRAALVSVRCDEYVYTGGAHGMTHALGRTWAIEGDTARELALDDLFVKPYVPTLDEKIVADLREHDADWFLDGSMTTVAENLHTWLVTKDGVMFVFDPYEVGSYAQGTHEVVVPWKSLAPVRRRPGPLDAINSGG